MSSAHVAILEYLRQPQNLAELNGTQRLEPIHFAALRAAMCLNVRIIPHERWQESRFQPCFPIKQSEMEELLRESRDDPVAFDAVVLLVQRAGEENYPLPPDLTAFVVEALRGEHSRPSTRGPSKYKNLARDQRIRIAVHITHTEHGLPFTRNESKVGGSACDVVADCLAELNLEPNKYATVAKIWQNRPFD